MILFFFCFNILAQAGAYALLGIAEDGLLLSTKRNSLCGVCRLLS